MLVVNPRHRESMKTPGLGQDSDPGLSAVLPTAAKNNANNNADNAVANHTNNVITLSLLLVPLWPSFISTDEQQSWWHGEEGIKDVIMSMTQITGYPL